MMQKNRSESKAFEFSLNVIKLLGWIIFNRFMALPVFLGYLLTKHPTLPLQVFIAIISIIFGIFSIWILERSYRR